MRGRLRDWVCTALCATLVLLASMASVAAEGRVALVIGNGSYGTAPDLINPRNDAKAMSAALKRLGFSVTEGFDLDHSGMLQTMHTFSEALDGADIALFFYAGHAVQIDGRNHLIPVRARIDSPADLDFTAVELRLVLRQMERLARNSIVLLDACRDNPFRQTLTRSIGEASTATSMNRGLARARMVGSALIGYATDPGEVASDGADGHSPFTRALLAHIETPGQEIAQALRDVRVDVLAATRNRQRPTVADYLLEDVYLAGRPVVASPTPLALAAEAWSAVDDEADASVLTAFLNDHGATPFGDLARARLEALAIEGTAPRVGTEQLALLDSPLIDAGEPGEIREGSAALPVTRPSTQGLQTPEIGGDAAFERPDGLPEQELGRPRLEGRALVTEVQRELTRLACDTAGIDGLWGGNSTRALEAFDTAMGQPSGGPDWILLERLQSLDGPVCATSCEAGFVLRNGACEKRAVAERNTAPARVCFTFNGTQRCQE